MSKMGFRFALGLAVSLALCAGVAPRDAAGQSAAVDDEEWVTEVIQLVFGHLHENRIVVYN